jgi:transketolase
MCSVRSAGTLASMRTYAELPGLMTVMTGDEKHGPSATSTLDVLWVLYDQVLRVSPDRLDDPGRDRFLLSKGHGPAAYYAVLAAKGFIPEWSRSTTSPRRTAGVRAASRRTSR